METIRVNPDKASEDGRDYRALQLPNKLKVILVSDPSTDKSGAALDVHVGHLSDPWEVPGIAHFLEHMLFLGTEKFPDENEYSQYLSLHGGSSNAYTDCDHTNFYFDVTPKHLDGALDRFSQFFLTPLLTESCTDREMKAVNSENEKNLANDFWRAMQLERSLSKPGHSYGKFGTGSIDTLDKEPKAKGINTREELLKFHQTWYSSNIMSLTVLGNQSLDELEELVTKYFSDVVNKDVTVPSWPDHPYALEATLVHLLPIKDVRQLQLSFPIPDYSSEYLSKPVSYLSHLIGHEGKGSLLSELKSLGYVNNLCSGLKSGAKGFDFFIVDVDLTETGIENTDDIIVLVFKYLAMLRNDGIKEWIFEECKHINEMLFRFKDKERPMNYVRSLAVRAHEYPLKEVLTGPWAMAEWKPELIKDVLDRLIPQNVYISIIGQKYADIVTETEKWYGTKYNKELISEEKIAAWSSTTPNENLFLPQPNEFIPTDFELAARDTQHTLGAIVPDILEETPLSRLWFLQDSEFLLPKACISLELFSTLAYASPHHTNLTQMFVRVFQDSLTEYAYDAELAGLWYAFSATKYGMSLDIRGYQQKQDVLLDKIIKQMKSFVVDGRRFEILKEAYVRALKNFEMEQPHTHASYRMQVIMTEKIWSKEELFQAATDDKLTSDALQAFIPELLGRIKIEMFIHGNLTPEKAKSILATVENRLKDDAIPLPAIAVLRNRQTALETGAASYYELENAIHKSHCIMTLYQIGLDSSRSNMLLQLFAQIIKESCFNVLRTKEQLGYIVFSGVWRQGGIHGLQFIIQSDKTPKYLDSRIENFLKETRDTIKDMDDEAFNRHKQALSDKRLEKPKKLGSRSEKIWTEITTHRYNFNRDEIEVAELSKLSNQDILDFYDTFIGESATKRRKLSTHVVSTAPKDEKEDKVEANNQEIQSLCGKCLTDIVSFKAGLPLHPLVQPFIELNELRRKDVP